MKKKVVPKYESFRDLTTGKIIKLKIEYEDSPYMEPDVPAEDYEPPEVLRTLRCPFQLDDPEVYKEITKPLRQVKFTCEVDVEISLAAVSEQEEKHKHEVIFEVPEEYHKPGVNPSEYELDFGSMFCGIFYNVTPKVQVKLLKKELIENKAVREYIEQIENKAKQEELAET